jgi:hypothetical protein
MRSREQRRNDAYLNLLGLVESGKIDTASERKLSKLVRHAHPGEKQATRKQIARAWQSDKPDELIELAKTGDYAVHHGLVHNKRSPSEAIDYILINSDSETIRTMAAQHPGATAKGLGGAAGNETILALAARIANPDTPNDEVRPFLDSKDRTIQKAFAERVERMLRGGT